MAKMTTKTRFAFPLAAMFLAGCVHSTRFVGPTGETMVNVRCNGWALDIGDCYNRAREECGGDYQVVNQQQGTAYVASINAYEGSVTPVAQREIMVQCSRTAGATGLRSVPASGGSGCHADDECARSEYCAPMGVCRPR